MLLIKILKKHPYLEKYFSEIFPVTIFLILYLLGCLNETLLVNIDYAGYTITVVSIMLGFYLANIFVISGAPKESILGNLHPKTQKAIFSYNSKAIIYSVLIIITYLFINYNPFLYLIFIFLVLSNIFAGIRIYGIMYISAKMEINKRIETHNELL